VSTSKKKPKESIATEDLPAGFKKDHEVRTSRFATGKCATCHGHIEAGDAIAKPKTMAAKRGGWSHIACSEGKSKSSSSN
jgi:hypothetical protein